MMIEKQKNQPLVIGIAGGTGSGKTTFSHELIRRLQPSRIVYISHDSYYKDQNDIPLEERTKQNYDHPDSLETDLLINHIQTLKQGQPIYAPIYDFVRHTRSGQTTYIEPQPVILIEGILIFAIKELRDLMDVKIFVDTDADIRFMRRLKRDIEERGRTMESVFEQYLQKVRPMHEAFVEPSKRFADIIVPSGGRNRPALDVVIAKINLHLSEYL